jgi:deoxyadenosine/deoxycytidine kinase
MHIAIAGNIGAGKTTLTKILAKQFDWDIRLEDVDDNPYLRDFYENMTKWAFHLQVYFLNSRFEQVHALRKGPKTVIQDRTIYEDAYIFAKSLYHSGHFSERDYQNYLRLFHGMINYVQPPDLLIYLKSDIGNLVSNIEKRGRDYEDAIRIDYLKNLNTHYEDWISSYTLGKKLIIDVNNIDFVKSSEDLSFIINKIDVELNGLFS